MPHITVPKVSSEGIAGGGNPGRKNMRFVNLLNAPMICSNGETSIFGITIRNPNSTTVYVNFYDGTPTTIGALGGVGAVALTPLIIDRIAIPGTPDTATPGQVIITGSNSSLYYFTTGLCIAAITTDSDTGSTAPSSGLYAMIQCV